METTCLQCGCRGSTSAFVSCVKCLDAAVHRYCLDVIPGYNEFSHWVCDECKDEAQNRKSTVDCHTYAEPAIKPIWMGSFHIWNKEPSMLDGVIAHISTRVCQEAYAELSQFQPVLHLEMLPKSAVWPKSFEMSELICDSIALYFFPSEISEWNFDLFVDEMMHQELAMRAFVQNAELLVFTSKALPSLYWRFQDQYYLWGVFRGKHHPPSNSHLCKEELGRHVMMHGVGGCKITETMKSCDARSLLETLRKGVLQEDKTRTRIHDGWEQAKPVNDSRRKAECHCHYCGFVSSLGGISHLKAHLGGEDPRIHVPGCCKVPPEAERIIADSISGCVQNKKAQCVKNILGKSRKRGRPLDDAWDHTIPMDDIRQGTKCKYCNFVSKRGGITRLKAHLGGGDPTMRIMGCPNVSPDIKILMEKEMKTFMERPKIPFQATAKSSGRGRPLDDAWEHCIPLDNTRQGAKCKYCNFVSKRGGIACLKAHLGGGDPTMRIRGCPNVSPGIKFLMEKEMKKFMERPKIPFQAATAKSSGRGRPLDGAWEHCIPLDNIRQGAKCKYCNFVSKRGGITCLKAHLGGGDPTMRIRGCPNVSPGIKILMENEMKKFMERPKNPFQATSKSSGRGRPLDDAWDHCITLDNIRQGAKCKYCNFVSKRGGIARLKAHLGGGDPIMRIRGCLNVSAEVKNLMAQGIKKCMKTPSGQSVGGIYKDMKI